MKQTRNANRKFAYDACWSKPIDCNNFHIEQTILLGSELTYTHTLAVWTRWL